jgi:murein DD-endopeptidase MepM/ murein hydrolase activator NlpD
MKAKKNNTISVLLIRGADNSNVSFNINLVVLKILASLFLVFIVALVIFVGYYGKITHRVFMISEILRENNDLKGKVEKIQLLSGEIDKIRSYEKKIKILTMNYGETATEKKTDNPPLSAPVTGSVKDESAYEKDIDDFVQNIKIYRNRDFINTKDYGKKQQKILESAPNILPVDGWISRGFQNLLDDEKTDHLGIDIAGAYDSPVKASGPGIVTFAGWKKDFGFLSEIDHGYGFVSRYGHCARLIVKKGDLVERGQTIAFVGSSGRSSAPHLHFEILKDGNKMDPLIYILK